MSVNDSMSNRDLEWSFDSINQRKKAADFVMIFESKLCIYSASIEQIYTNYTINFPNEDVEKMVILPNPYAFHDTFHSVSNDCIRDTGLHVIPGETIGKSGLYLVVRYKNKKVQPAPIPFEQAIDKILQSQNTADPFLPILIKGDLREFNSGTPCMHLHRIKLDELTHLSEFEKKGIQNSITDKLKELKAIAGEVRTTF
ncbi:hypothetical protein [Marinicellulosiphila megalodicopiae]|uniref:hypothetical protein n=1 Tax=Marinicellulosiphila megalodicopiae TaxID=2724896 RepID=UPI003BAFD283